MVLTYGEGQLGIISSVCNHWMIVTDSKVLTAFQRSLLRLLNAPWFLPACIVLAVALRGTILMVQPLQQTSDFQWYFEGAGGIARGEGFNQGGILTAFWPVGWPGALAALFTVTGVSVLAGQIANLLMAALACLMTAVLGGKLFKDRATGRLAALLIAIFPNQIAYVPLLSTEIFYEVLLLLCLYLLIRERVLPALLAGLLFGVATLTKTQTLALPGFLFLWVFLAGRTRATLRRFVVLVCAVYIMLVVVVAPWTYRNWTVFHEVILVSTNGGWTLLTGNNPETNGDFTPDTILAEGLNHSPADQVAMDKLARGRAVAWITANPGRFISLIPRKIMRLWMPDGESEWFYQRGFAAYDSHVTLFRAARVVNQAYYFMLLVLAIPSIWILMRRRLRSVSPWAHAGIALFVYFTLISMVFSGQSRFHFSLMPFVAMYAAWTAMRASAQRTGLFAGHS